MSNNFFVDFIATKICAVKNLPFLPEFCLHIINAMLCCPNITLSKNAITAQEYLDMSLVLHSIIQLLSLPLTNLNQRHQ